MCLIAFSLHVEPLPYRGDSGREGAGCAQAHCRGGGAREEESVAEETQEAEDDAERLDVQCGCMQMKINLSAMFTYLWSVFLFSCRGCLVQKLVPAHTLLEFGRDVIIFSKVIMVTSCWRTNRLASLRQFVWMC